VSGTVTYDTFMRLSANERLETFQGLTPGNQSACCESNWPGGDAAMPTA